MATSKEVFKGSVLDKMELEDSVKEKIKTMPAAMVIHFFEGEEESTIDFNTVAGEVSLTLPNSEAKFFKKMVGTSINLEVNYSSIVKVTGISPPLGFDKRKNSVESLN